MRTLLKNRQKMKYSLATGKVPTYQVDADGNVIYTEINGDQVPLETGEFDVGYTDPVEFSACISGKLKETLIKEFGVVNDPNYAQIVCDKGELPFQVGTIIWRVSEVGYKNGIIDGSSADYEVRGVIDEGLDIDIFFLHKNAK